MKKLLTVLCVAALGIGAAAQAQVVRTDGSQKLTANDLKAKMTVGMADYAAPGTVQAQLKDEFPTARPYDTLVWHDEYLSEKCDSYYTLVEYIRTINDLFTNDYMPTPFGNMWSGTGEMGATYQTENNIYKTYARIDLESSWVVGAVAYVYRKGNPAAWNGLDISKYEQREVNGVMVPDLPCKLKGYPKVAVQPAYYDYYDMITGASDGVLIDVEMPLSIQDAVETPEQTIRYYEPGKNGNDPWPTVHRIGGLFNHVFPANANFGLSIQTELTHQAAYDSLWNWSVTAKSNRDMCTFVDAWASWIRIDYSHPEGFQWLIAETDVSKDWGPNEEDGFAPVGCPQHDNGKSLFVYAFSQGLSLEGEDHFLPMLYPIVQDRTSIERNQDAFAQTVSVYPLPATDKVNVVALDEIQKVEIYNMAGTLVKAIAMNDVRLELDVTSFAPGTYIAKITTVNGVASKKLVIK